MFAVTMSLLSPIFAYSQWIALGPATNSVAGYLYPTTGAEIANHPPSEEPVSVYPQPAYKTLYVKLTSRETADVRILLATLQGKEMFNASARVGRGETIVTINTEAILPGTYLLTVHTGALRHVQEVVFETSDATK